MNRMTAFLTMLLLVACGEPGPPDMDVTTLLGGDDIEGYQRAYEARPFAFPEDHGPHPGYRDEWWYVTGHLEDAQQRRYGYQLTFFRHQVRPGQDPGGWSSPQVYMAHFALSELDREEFVHAERFGRPGAGVAGARSRPFRVWLDDWELASTGKEFSPLRLSARHGETRLELVLEPRTPPVLQGEQGLSAKSPEPGNASYYYSFPRLATRGKLVTSAGEQRAVTGESWMDREWSTSVLGDDQVGWDWFALHLDDGRALMLFQLRRADATPSFGSGSLVCGDGRSQTLELGDFRLVPGRQWRAPDGRRYPVEWQLEVPAAGLRGEVRAAFDAQWFAGSVRYWEGVVDLFDPDGEPLGRGYLEMTGY